MIVARAPFRVSLLGGGSDFPEHFEKHSGAVLGGGINRYCIVTVRRRPQAFGTTFRVRYSKIDEGSVPSDIDHPAVRHLLDRLQIAEPIDLNHSSDLPSRSGIGSSSAFLAASLIGLAPNLLDELSPYELARLLSSIERVDLGETSGMQDVIFSVFGGFNLIEFTDRGFSVFPSKASRNYLRSLSESCFLIYLNTQRLSSSQQASFVQQMSNPEPLNELADMARQTFHDIECESLSPKDLGRRVAQGWELKKASSPMASTPRIDELDRTMQDLGSWGGKILGAGGGGFFLVIAPPGTREAFQIDYPAEVTCGFEWDYSGISATSI